MVSPAQRFRPEIMKNIQEVGQHLMGIGAGDGVPCFVYTIGNYYKGFPDLLMIGVIAGEAMNFLGKTMRDRNMRFGNGEIVDLGGKFPVKVIDADPIVKTMFTIQAGQFYGHENYKVQQVLVPDKTGIFPDDPKCAEPFNIEVYSES